MTKVNYKSDFDAILRIKDCSGEDLEWPTFDWYAKLYTIQYGRDNKANMYVASCVGGVCTNCFNDNGYIHIVVDNHHLGIGTLAVEFVAKIPDAKYPDEHHRIVTPQALDIELVTGKGDCAPVFEAVITVPVHGGMTKAEIEGLLAAGGYTRELTFGFSNRDAEDWSADHPACGSTARRGLSTATALWPRPATAATMKWLRMARCAPIRAWCSGATIPATDSRVANW